MTSYLQMVERFHREFDIPIGATPRLIGQISFARRLRLMTEELSEYCKAVAEGDIVNIADALADLLYVVFGSAIEHGLPMDEIFELVHKSNMTKTGGYRDKSGKWIKSSTYVPVDLTFLRGSTSHDKGDSFRDEQKM